MAIHQPNYIPWLGYLCKLALSDVFVFLDDVQFTKNGFTNRNRIKTVDGAKWLTIPVHARIEWTIAETKWSETSWPKKHLKSLTAAYGRAVFYHEVMEWFSERLLNSSSDNLADLNTNLIRSLAAKLKLACSFQRSSDFHLSALGDQRLIEIVQRLDGTAYLSGHGGKNYQDALKFEAAGLKLHYYDFVPLQYPQLWGDFVPGLSVLDTLFNCGFDGTRSIIDSLVHKGE